MHIKEVSPQEQFALTAQTVQTQTRLADSTQVFAEIQKRRLSSVQKKKEGNLNTGNENMCF